MIEELLFMFFEKSEKVWRIGAAMLSCVFLLLTFPVMQYAIKLAAIHKSGSISSQIEVFSWIPYAGPIVCLLLAVCFGLKAFQGHRNHQQF